MVLWWSSRHYGLVATKCMSEWDIWLRTSIMWALHSRQLAECTISHIETLSSLSGQLFWQLMAWGGHKVSELAPSLPKFLFVVKYSVLKKEVSVAWYMNFNASWVQHPCMIRRMDNQKNRYIIHIDVVYMYDVSMYSMDDWTNAKADSKSWCDSGKWFWN